MVNRGRAGLLANDGSRDLDRVEVRIPVGDGDHELTETPLTISCVSPGPQWACEGPEMANDGKAVLTIRPVETVSVARDETICFRLEALNVNAAMGQAALRVDQRIDPRRARTLLDRWVTVFKTAHSPVRHDDLVDVRAEQHHPRYTDDEAFQATLGRDGAGCGLDADTVDGRHAHEIGAGVWTEAGDDIYYHRGDGVDARVGIGTTDPRHTLDVNGDARVVGVLEIFGGSDVAEPFTVEGGGDVGPGMVVSIDPASTGRLRLSDAAYDRRVAGVISGANGVPPGLTLRKAGGDLDGSHPVALTGRVWAWCDADAAGPIAPGDLLTTSSTPGHAMKVADHGLARGAILGKAMSSLESGQGQVLVLVTLQ